MRRLSIRLRLFLALPIGAVLAVGLLAGLTSATAAPSPSSLTVGVGGAAPGTASFTGGPITGSADASGSVSPVVCQAPACEALPVTLKAPAGTPGKALTLTVSIAFTPTSGTSDGQGLDGLDLYLLDSAGNVVGVPSQSGASPAVSTAAGLDPGTYTIEVTGENAAVQISYKGTAAAALTPPVVATGGTGAAFNTLSFGPATVVSPVIMGGEPQLTFERAVASPAKGAGLDPNRGFVDWPVSSRTMIGTLWRTVNGGASYRQIVDTTCAARQVPNCYTGGGGDTVNRVNNYDGTVDFGDQESLAQEAFASSIDHGDSFPAARQSPVTSSFTGVDRQWIATVDAPGYPADPSGSSNLQAIFSYHIPAAGEIVAGIGADGVVRPGVPVLPNVSQSGPSITDTHPGSPGAGWFYQPYRDGGGFEVGAAPIGSYQNPTAYHVGTVTTNSPPSFPWLGLDRAGNLYAVWVGPDGNTYLSVSPITNPKNDPKATPAGVPATFWTPKVRVNPPGLDSTMFPEMVAGDPGRIAIVFMAASGYSGISDNAPPTTRWMTYAAISTDALSGSPTFSYGAVSHRVAHVGNICTSGTTCVATMKDRSLLDMIDIDIDAAGRPLVVYSDNNNQWARDEVSTGSQGSAYIKVAPLTVGPSLFADRPGYDIGTETQCVRSAAGDAGWPNTAAGKNLPGLDVVGACLATSGDQLVARIPLTAAGAAAFTAALNGYNAVRGTDPQATRLQYVVRWDAGNDNTYYMAAEADSAGKLTYYGGKVTGANTVSNVNSAVALDYIPVSGYTVTGTLDGNTLVLTAPLKAFASKVGDTLYSVQAFSLVGPDNRTLGGQPETDQVLAAMRNLDTSPPFDAVLGPLALASTQGVPGVPAGTPKPPAPPRCPVATGSLHGSVLGPLRLGLTQAAARARLPRYVIGGRTGGVADVFCLRPIGIRALYATPAVVRGLPARAGARLVGRVALLMSADPRYAFDRVHPGAPARALNRLRPRLLGAYALGVNRWYVARSGAVRGVFKVSGGVVREVGVLDGALRPTRARTKRLLLNLGA